jgi:hypothetical protein
MTLLGRDIQLGPAWEYNRTIEKGSQLRPGFGIHASEE